MRNVLLVFVSVILLSCGNESKQKDSHGNHTVENDSTSNSKSLSPHTSTMAMIGGAHIHIDYSSPSVRDRIIFGGLVGYNTVWQAGAHKATWIETDRDLVIDNKTLPAGKYGLFVIPGKDSWEVRFNKNWDQHGKDDYNKEEDVVKLNVKPIQLENTQEALVYKIEERQNNKGVISLAWEKTKIEIPFEVSQE